MVVLCEQVADPPAVSGYTLLEKLGEGGMGEVYLARRDRGGERVAIKFLAPARGMDEREQRQRFERETQLMSGLCHPHIVRVLDHGHAAGRPYLVMEFVPGRSLRGCLQPGRPLPVPQARRILAEAAHAIAYLGDAGVVHRDLKPDNVLLDSGGQVKVTDFGISVALTEIGQLTSTAEVLGTVDYVAPEQRARLPVDQRADQFSLAVIAYELLTAKRPFGRFKPPSHLNRHLHPTVDAVLARALQEDPDDRYADVRDFAAALDTSLRRRPRRWPRAALLVVGVAAAAWTLGGLLVWAIHGGAGQAGVAFDRRVGGPVFGFGETAQRAAQMQYFLDQGDRHLQAGRDRNAESCYTEAIRLSPRDPLPYTRRAFLYKKCEAHQKALDDLQAALNLDSTLVDAWTGRGSIYVNLQDYQRAVPALDQALLLDPQAAPALAYRGWAWYKLGKADLARRDLDAAVAANPDWGEAYQFRAIFHKTLKEYGRSRTDFENAVRCMPDNPFAHSGLAQLLANWKDASDEDRRQAVEYARRACELTQWRDWQQLRYLAMTSAAVGDLPAAVTWCEKAIASAPVTERKRLENQLAAYRKRAGAERRASP